MRRLLALLAAAAMIVAALVVRDRIDEDGGGGNSAPLRLVCAEELEVACSGLDAELTVEKAPSTAERLGAESAADPGLDAWLVADPWPAIVDIEREGNGLAPLFPSELPPLARSPLVVVGSDALDGCGWRCLGDGEGPAEVRLGWRPPDESAVGLLTVGAVAAGYQGGPDFASNDIDTAFRRWLDAFVERTRPAVSPVTATLVNPAEFATALSWEADALRQLEEANSARVAGRRPSQPEPVATVDVILAPTSGDADRDVAGHVTETLRDLGWRAADDGELPRTSGLPAAGVLVALQQEVAT